MQQYPMDRGLLSSFIYFLLLLAGAALFLLQVDFSPEKNVRINGDLGEMRLAFWYPDTSQPLKLEGDWLGFPDQLLTPGEVRRNLSSSVPIRFPDVWQPPKPRRHVMTYTLLLKRVPTGTPLALKIPEVKNSFRLFLDDREIAAGGFSSDNSDENVAYFGDRIVELGTLAPEVRLTLQVSNFGHSRGGVHHAPILASQDYWTRYYRINMLIECVVISLALIAGCLILLEFYLVPEHKELLWISLFSLVLAGYIGTSGLGGFATLMPGFPWEVAVRLEYIGFVAAIPLFLKWLAALYRQDVQYRLIRWLSWGALGLTAYVLLTPSALFTELLYPLLAFLCLCILVSGWVMLKLFILNRSGIRILVFGALALMTGILHDLLLFLYVLQGRELLSFGVLVFLISQIGFLTFYRTQEQLRILDLNQALKETASELEKRIQWRTQELESRAQELERRKVEYQRLQKHDELTGLMNRHHFLDLVERRLERVRALGYSLIIVDVDHYKLIVDHHGREFAESILRQLARLLEEVCEGYFERIPARYGGDEFILWLGRTGRAEAEELAQEIRRAASRIQLPLLSQPGERYRFTVSTGVASAGDSVKDLNTLLARAADAVHQNRRSNRAAALISTQERKL